MNILEKEDFDSLVLEGKELTVTHRFKLYELFQRPPSKEWIKGTRSSLALVLANNTWIMKVPSKEAGSYIWLKLELKETGSTLSSFYRGGDTPDTWGPARIFAKSEQKREVTYSLYGENWKLVDIGSFEVSGEGNSLVVDGDQLHFVTSRSGKKWLVYLDARKGEADGSGGVLIGEEFNPDTDVSSVL